MVQSENSQPKAFQKRWYDQYDRIAHSIGLMEEFPPEFQCVLGESIIAIAENQCQVKNLMGELRELGPEKVLGLFKSKNKQRKYDSLPEVHQGINYMYILPDEQRLFIAEQLIELVDSFQKYFALCRKSGQEPRVMLASQLSKTYLQEGKQATEAWLSQAQMDVSASPTQDLAQTITYDERLDSGKDGMRIRLEKEK
jgi:hypothetical protein